MQTYRKCSIIVENKEYRKKISWVMGILISIDQFGNAIARGNPDSTISARIGYNNRPNGGISTKYWRTLEKVVDITFEPIDGPRHCLEAYYSDRHEDFTAYEIVKLIPKIILAVIVGVSCIPIFIFIRLWVIIFPKIKSRYILSDATDEQLIRESDLDEEGIELSKEFVIELIESELNLE